MSTHVAEQLLFSIVSLLLTFDFDLILGSIFAFWGLNGLFLELEWGLRTVLGSTLVLEQLSFYLCLSILTFYFDLIWGSFLTFWGPNGLFSGVGVGLKNYFGDSSYRPISFVFRVLLHFCSIM